MAHLAKKGIGFPQQTYMLYKTKRIPFEIPRTRGHSIDKSRTTTEMLLHIIRKWCCCCWWWWWLIFAVNLVTILVSDEWRFLDERIQLFCISERKMGKIALWPSAHPSAPIHYQTTTLSIIASDWSLRHISPFPSFHSGWFLLPLLIIADPISLEYFHHAIPPPN